MYTDNDHEFDDDDDKAMNLMMTMITAMSLMMKMITVMNLMMMK